jgi:nucleoside 2-deoxyribosyltransferase
MQHASDGRSQKFIFVLMPFSPGFEDTYKLGIKPACEASGAYCERIDEQIFVENMLLRLYAQIKKADLIVADMSDRNPNVFYEVGYAHGLNKKVILLTKSTDDIPFDLRHYQHIVYSGRIASLKDELQRRVEWYLDQPDQVEQDRSSEVEQTKVVEPIKFLAIGENNLMHLRKLGHPEGYGSFYVGSALPRELEYLENMGFIRFKGDIKGLDDFLDLFRGREGQNLSDYVGLTEAGKLFLESLK